MKTPFTPESACFLLLYELKSVNAAARKLGANPGNISRMLGRFEKEIGAPLFLRHQTGLRPTPFADRLFRALQKAEREFNNGIAQSSGEKIKVGFSPTVGYAHFTAFLKPLLDRDLGADFSLDTSISLIERIKKRELDLVIVASLVKFPGLIAKSLAAEDVVLASSGRKPHILLASPDMIGLPRFLDGLAYKQHWELSDYFVIAKFLEEDARLMGLLPESLVPAELHVLKRFPGQGKITALSWPGSPAAGLLRTVTKK